MNRPAADFLPAGIADFLARGGRILTSTRRLSHTLKLDYARAQQAAGCSVWPTPAILPWSTWLREFWSAGDRGGDSLPGGKLTSYTGLRRRLLSPFQAQLLWQEIVEASAVGQRLLDPAGAARTAARGWQRLHEYSISREDLAAADTEEARALLEWGEGFETLAAAGGWIDDAALSAVLQSSDSYPDQPLWLLGFDRLTPQMQTLLQHWRELGCSIKADVPASGGTAQPAIAVIGLPDSGGELETAARWARARLEQGRQRIAVVIADLEFRAAEVQRVFAGIFSPALRHIESDEKQPAFALAAATPLSDYPVVQAALLCLQIGATTNTHRVDSIGVGRLLRSPFIRGGLTEAALRAAADARLREEGRAQWNLLDLQRWAALNACVELQTVSTEVLRVIGTHRRRASASEWTQIFASILQAFGWGSDERGVNSAELQTSRRFREVLADLGTLDDTLSGVMTQGAAVAQGAANRGATTSTGGAITSLSYAAALALLGRLLTQTRFEPESPAAPVLIIDPQTVAGMHFDAAWVTGMDASAWPPPPQPDPYIPFELQRRAGLAEAGAEENLKLARSRVERLAGSAAEVIFSWSEREGDAALRPTPLIERWPRCEPADLRLPVFALPAQQIFAARPTLLRSVDRFAPPVTTLQVMGGASTVDLQSRCAFRAQAELRLGARPLRTVSPQIRPEERGMLVHRVLQDVWNQLGSQQGLSDVNDVELADRVRALTEFHAPRALRPDSPLRARLAAIEIDAAVEVITTLLKLERQRAPFKVRRAEQDELFRIGDLRLKIQPDRIDELADGRHVLIDYKTGASFKASDWLDRRPGRPARAQLPLYAVAHANGLAALSFAVLSPRAVAFRGYASDAALLPDVNGWPAGVRKLPPAIATWPTLLTHWREVVEALAADFAAGEAAVAPLPTECRLCHLASLCRINESQTLAELGQEGDEGAQDEEGDWQGRNESDEQ